MINRVASIARGLGLAATRFVARAGANELRRAAFVLVEVPLAAVKRRLLRRERPPLPVDELVAEACHATAGGARCDGGASMR